MFKMEARLFQAIPEPSVESLELTEENVKIARVVLRLKHGSRIDLVDGSGLVAESVLEKLERKKGSVRIVLRRRHRCPVPEITLLQGIPKGDKPARIVQQAVEWGIARIVFLATEHAVPQKRESALGRWRKVAAEALRQSGNPFLPRIEGPVPLDASVLPEGSAVSVLFDENEKTRMLRDVLAGGSPDSVRIAIGPEGGWSDAERALFREAGFQSASLAPYILRTDTAAVSAIAAVYTLIGGSSE
ncbi:MAG: RsmE family RNA methyltransferase [Pseudomonadota bacterium]